MAEQRKKILNKEFARNLIGGTILVVLTAVFTFLITRPQPFADVNCAPDIVEVNQLVECTNDSQYTNRYRWKHSDAKNYSDIQTKRRFEFEFETPGQKSVFIQAVGRGGNSVDEFQITVQRYRELTSAQISSLSEAISIRGVVDGATLQTQKSIRIDQTNDRHSSVFGESSQCYTRTVEADEGFEITGTRFNSQSSARVSGQEFTISGDRQSGTYRFCLTAGPEIDRYRGWLRGNLILSQERGTADSVIILAEGLPVSDVGTYLLSTSVDVASLASIAITDDRGIILASGEPTAPLYSPTGVKFEFGSTNGAVSLTVGQEVPS